MNHETLLKLWNESWDQGIWIAPWRKAVEDLSATQAAWRPAPNRHCVWQIVEHVCFWREYTLAKAYGRATPSKDEVERANFAMPETSTEAEWRRSIERLQQSHEALRAAIKDSNAAPERLPYHLGHDCYHLGQIMLLRAMQGLAPIE